MADQVVSDFIEESMQTEDVVDQGWTATGCASADATKYTVLSYLSLARDISSGEHQDTKQELYKMSISGADESGTCEDMLKAVEAVAGLFDGGFASGDYQHLCLSESV
ncbi:hypothetical protein Micbo1qcDRAFT_178487 [Microdochium bolleyi]|uniref:Uncharacterized protein n=1 Tax=Microdochium bolleyi TaxID=196109 RepID=A0A136ISL1_9PEZI|nr:hypothetical protein Micbo1qcDRAFT_178487 [Microdochium bolleyi]